MPWRWLVAGGVAVLIVTVGAWFFWELREPQPGHVLDEAKLGGREAVSFKAAGEDYFRKMDGGIALSPEEVQGRNTWIVWTGGDDRLWDTLATSTFGGLDFLKTLSSRKDLKFSRATRWDYLGLVNEPCFTAATGPDPDHWGLWLDKRMPESADCPADPFADEQHYPGVKLGARGRTLPSPAGPKLLPVGSYYGEPTGIVGLRLFTNPAFDEAAAKKWDPERFYTDPSYYLSKDLVRPYRVGMSCGFCHVGPNPVDPPADPENPKWENLSSLVGAQYFWVDRIFFWDADKTSYIFQVFHASRPGTVDTSAISTDNINNPRTMNAVYNLGERLQLGKRLGQETLAGGALNNKQFNDYFKSGPLTQFFKAPNTVWTPHVLKDGADSVGALGALNRVYLNIGLFSEEWLLHFRPIVGGKPISPIEISVAQENSAYWNATEDQAPNLAQFLVKAGAPHKLHDAPGGDKYLTQDPQILAAGRKVFADTCARCHSSKLPPLPAEADPAGQAGPDYLKYFNAYWAYTKTPEFQAAMEKIVDSGDFLDNNFLSTDLRVPVTLLKTNACSPLATNGIADNIWDNFTSQSYKDLPPVGAITVRNPITGQASEYNMPGGGRGYTRPPSLVSVWSTAPFFLNNALGPFESSPSVEARLRSFDASIQMLLWPEKRVMDPVLGAQGVYLIDRTDAQSYIKISVGFLPDFLQGFAPTLNEWFPNIFGEDGIQIGPIPQGTPVNLIANTMLLPEQSDPAERLKHKARLVDLAGHLIHDLKQEPAGADDTEAKKAFGNLVDPLLELSKCPDFEVNRGHYFGTGVEGEGPALSDGEKQALIEFLKTF